MGREAFDNHGGITGSKGSDRRWGVGRNTVDVLTGILMIGTKGQGEGGRGGKESVIEGDFEEIRKAKNREGGKNGEKRKGSR